MYVRSWPLIFRVLPLTKPVCGAAAPQPWLGVPLLDADEDDDEDDDEVPDVPEDPPEDVVLLPEVVPLLDEPMGSPPGSGPTVVSVPLVQAEGSSAKKARPEARAEARRGERTGREPPARAAKQLKS